MGHACPQLPVLVVQLRIGQTGVHSTLHVAHAVKQLRVMAGLHAVEGVPGFPHPDSFSVTDVVVPDV